MKNQQIRIYHWLPSLNLMKIQLVIQRNDGLCSILAHGTTLLKSQIE